MNLRKLKVLHILTHLDLGGAQKETLALLKRLDRRFFSLYLASSPSGFLVEEAFRIPALKVILNFNLKRKISPFFDLISLLRLFLFIKIHRFDIVHTHSPKAGILGRWAAKLAGVRLIIHTVHGLPLYEGQNWLLKRLVVFAEAVTAKVTDYFIFVSEADIKKARQFGIVKEEKYSLIREGIEIREPNKKTVSIKKEQAQFIIGMIAPLKRQKAPLDFVKAASMVKKESPDVKFVLIGEGRLRKRVERLVRRLDLGDNFLLLGWQPDAFNLIQYMDIVVLTSLWEGLPISLLEAMYWQRPIVATNVDGVRELIKDGENGFLVAPRDYCRVAQKIILLMRNQNLARKLGSINREKILPKFNLDVMVDKTQRLYFDLLREN